MDKSTQAFIERVNATAAMREANSAYAQARFGDMKNWPTLAKFQAKGEGETEAVKTEGVADANAEAEAAKVEGQTPVAKVATVATQDKSDSLTKENK